MILMDTKIIKFKRLKELKIKHAGKKIVQCHGIYDLLHHGHLLHLNSAKKFGDILVVTITPDRYVNKGPGRPRFSEQERAEMLAALQIVDYVVINNYPKAIEPIKQLRPDFYVKGPDYRDKEKDITRGIYEEEEAVNSVGGKLVFTDDETESATSLINTYFSQWDEEQAQTIAEVKNIVSLDQILNLIDRIGEFKVLVIGEPIVDTYIFCQPENLSSKSPSISAKYIREENYAGGSLAIARHLDALGCEVTLLITHGNEKYFQDMIWKIKNETNIVIDAMVVEEIPTPRKTRFIDPFRAQRMFEIIDVRHDQWETVDARPFVEKIGHISSQFDTVIVADFGHGLFEHEVLDNLEYVKAFVGLDVQTNSENYGYNFFHKHRHFDYISVDERECRLGMHDRITPIDQLALKAVIEKIRKPTSITLGGSGSMFFNEKGEKVFCPSYFREVVDTTGAGDAYFAITSLLVKLGAPQILVPFIGNLFAGLKTRIIGNKYAVSKVDLIRTVKSILG